jgi:Coenzyme F420-reducing hydrogenase, beta subunit
MNNQGKYLIIGLPCHITSLTLLLNKKRYIHLKERIYAKVALLCGYSFDRNIVKAFNHYNRIKEGVISYREDGRYRKTRISNSLGSVVFDIKKPRNLMEYIHNRIMTDPFLAQNACLHCIDHLGYCSDISVGDAWQSRYAQDDKGINIIIVRTTKGLRLLEVNTGYFLEEGHVKDIVDSQSKRYAYGYLGRCLRNQLGEKYNSKAGIVQENISSYLAKDQAVLQKKIKIKKLLEEKKFNRARFLYSLIELKSILKTWGKMKIRGKI